MYRAFYGLREKPFNLTPDPRFLYLSDKHKEAFAHLRYGILSRSGFIMVTGEIGTGKTTICRNLLNRLDEDTELAFIFNPMLSPLELLKKIASEFGIDTKGTNTLELTEELNQYLLEAAAKGKNCVLLIDEAQNLAPQVLEQIRLLSNLETETEKLLQIVLIGQPELGEKLALHELRQLNQRIAARYHLKPLSEKEVLQYIAYRLHVAGGRRKIKFARGAVRAVYKISGGTPRVINAVCDRALLIGFTKEVHTITASIVKRAYNEIRGDVVFGKGGPRRTLKQRIFHPITGAAVLMIVVIAFANSPVLRQRTQGYLDSVAALLPEAPLPAATQRPDPSTQVPPSAESDGNTPAGHASTDTANTATSPGQVTMTQHILGSKPTDGPTLNAEKLFSMEQGRTIQTALESLLAAWEKSSEGDLPDTLDKETLDAFAVQNGLSIEFLNPAISQLIALDLPALVEMKHDDTTRAVTLRGVTDDVLTLASGDATWQLDRSDFRNYYTGNAIVLWQDPTPNASPLLPGARNANVRKLRTALSSFGRLPANDPYDTYDGVVSKAVSRIQSETSLDVDGIAGKQVRMVLVSWAKSDGTPSLGAEANQPQKATEDVAVAVTKPAREKTEAAVSTPESTMDEAETPPPTPLPETEAIPTPLPAPTTESEEIIPFAQAETVPSSTTPDAPETLGPIVSEAPSNLPPESPQVETPNPVETADAAVTLSNVSNETKDTDTDTETDADADTDTETETDADTDTETDTDAATPGENGESQIKSTPLPAPGLQRPGAQLTVEELPDPGVALTDNPADEKGSTD